MLRRSRRFFSSIYSDPNFPLTADGRVHHLDVKGGEVASRVLSVGDAARGKRISAFLDGHKSFEHKSSRGFVVHTGLFQGVPVTIAVTGMGYPMMDFVVRELRACVRGPMAMIRFGTCGGFGAPKPGDIVFADESILVRREPDFFTADKDAPAGFKRPPSAYSMSLPLRADATLGALFRKSLEAPIRGLGFHVHRGLNATADTFYSTQGRIGTMFVDANETLNQDIRARYPKLASMEMETFHLYDMARSSKGSIVAAAAAITIANREGTGVVSHEDLTELEAAGGKAALTALAEMPLAVVAPAETPVWTKQ